VAKKKIKIYFAQTYEAVVHSFQMIQPHAESPPILAIFFRGWGPLDVALLAIFLSRKKLQLRGRKYGGLLSIHHFVSFTLL